MNPAQPHPGEDRPLSVALRAVERAPSVYNTRPWIVTEDDGRITVGTDPERRLDVADPQSRELIISCGAALYTIRVALRGQGVLPEVALLPDPDKPGRLAEVGIQGTAEPDEPTRALAEAITRRRTHRGLFATDVDDVALFRAMSEAAAAEGAALAPLTSEPLIRSMSGLVAAAEHLHRHERAHSEELAHWVRGPASSARDGVHAEDFPPEEEAGLFPGRDFGHQRIRGMFEAPGEVLGTCAVLTTDTDTRGAWLAAGQALQRVLLTGASDGVAAAFHTQPLEEPLLRGFITERICGGAYPQVILRLGRPRQHGSPPGDSAAG